MSDDRFDTFSRILAASTSRRTVLRGALAAAIPGSVTFARGNAARAKPNKVPICTWDPGTSSFDTKHLPPPAEAQVNSGKALYPITNSDDFCPSPCGPQCLMCGQLPSNMCTKCVNGQCTCPDSEAGALSFQGGSEGTTPLPGTQYQIFNYDEGTQTIGSTALSGVQTATDGTAVVFGPYPGDSDLCVREVFTPPGYSIVGHDFACLHLGCGHQFLWDFRHAP